MEVIGGERLCRSNGSNYEASEPLKDPIALRASVIWIQIISVSLELR